MLIIEGSDLDPTVVSKELRRFPDHAWRRGERPLTRTRKGRVVETPAVAEHGCWKEFIPDSKRELPLDEQLQYWVDLLAALSSGVRRLLDLGYVITLSCYIDAAEPLVAELSPALLESAARLGVGIELHFFPSPEVS